MTKTKIEVINSITESLDQLNDKQLDSVYWFILGKCHEDTNVRTMEIPKNLSPHNIHLVNSFISGLVMRDTERRIKENGKH